MRLLFTMGKEVCLQFSSMREVLLFCAYAHVSFYEINLRTCTLTCECGEQDLAVALSVYKAILLEGPSFVRFMKNIPNTDHLQKDTMPKLNCHKWCE